MSSSSEVAGVVENVPQQFERRVLKKLNMFNGNEFFEG